MSVLHKLRGYLSDQPPSPATTGSIPLGPSPTSAAPTPPTEDQTPIGPPPSTLHARLVELLDQLIDTRVPSYVYGLLGRALPILHSVGALKQLGIALPTLPTDLPRSAAELKSMLRRELWARPVAEIEHLIIATEGTASAWLNEYWDGQAQAAIDKSFGESPTDERSPEPAPDADNA